MRRKTLENQVEQNMQNEMETGFIFLRPCVYILGNTDKVLFGIRDGYG